MDIMSPEDRVVLWRAAVDADGAPRETLIRAVAKEVYEGLGSLDLYADDYAQLTVESLATLDEAGLFASDGLRHCLESLHEPDGGAEVIVAEMAGLLRGASGVESLDVQRRLRAVEMAGRWREHVLTRQRPEPAYLSVGDVAARYGVTTQAVYKWLAKKRIDATRGPGGSWRIPAAQFERDTRSATSRESLDRLQQHLITLHAGNELPPEQELGERLRGED
jgi:excisionase family DNA binding protein